MSLPRSVAYKTDPDYIKLNKFQKAFYEVGDAFLPDKIKDALDIDLIGSHKNTFYISGWSIMHMISGLLTGYIYLRVGFLKPANYFLVLFILHTLWELLQVLIGMAHPNRLTGSSNFVDTLVDTVMFMFGAYVTKSLWK